MANGDQLRELMERHGLSRTVAARLLGVARPTINSWLAPPGAASFRAMPGPMLRLALLTLGEARRPPVPAARPARPARAKRPELLPARAKRRARRA